MFTFDFPLILNQSSNQVKNILFSSVFRYAFSSDHSPLHKGMKKEKKKKNKTRTKNNQLCDTCSLVKKWEPILNEQVKTLEVQQLKLRI